MSTLRERIEDAVYGATPASRKQAAQAAKWILALPEIAAALERREAERVSTQSASHFWEVCQNCGKPNPHLICGATR